MENSQKVDYKAMVTVMICRNCFKLSVYSGSVGHVKENPEIKSGEKLINFVNKYDLKIFNKGCLSDEILKKLKH